jgi:antitoxin MazE
MYLLRRYKKGGRVKTRVQKWGNSLALRIPKSFAVEAALHVDAAVELSLVEGAIIIRPIKTGPLNLADLLSGITKDNIPVEWNTGPAVGRELW